MRRTWLRRWSSRQIQRHVDRQQRLWLLSQLLYAAEEHGWEDDGLGCCRITIAAYFTGGSSYLCCSSSHHGCYWWTGCSDGGVILKEGSCASCSRHACAVVLDASGSAALGECSARVLHELVQQQCGISALQPRCHIRARPRTIAQARRDDGVAQVLRSHQMQDYTQVKHRHHNTICASSVAHSIVIEGHCCISSSGERDTHAA